MVALIRSAFRSEEVFEVARDAFAGAYRPVWGLTLFDSRGPLILLRCMDKLDVPSRLAAESYVAELTQQDALGKAASSLEAAFAILVVREFQLTLPTHVLDRLDHRASLTRHLYQRLSG
jgi:hypothetical protein